MSLYSTVARAPLGLGSSCPVRPDGPIVNSRRCPDGMAKNRGVVHSSLNETLVKSGRSARWPEHGWVEIVRGIIAHDQTSVASATDSACLGSDSCDRPRNSQPRWLAITSAIWATPRSQSYCRATAWRAARRSGALAAGSRASWIPTDHCSGPLPESRHCNTPRENGSVWQRPAVHWRDIHAA